MTWFRPLFMAVFLGSIAGSSSHLLAQDRGHAVEPQAVVSSVGALLQQIETANSLDIGKDPTGSVVEVTLRQGWANNHNLALLSTLDSVRRLVMIPSRRDKLTEHGFSTLGKLPNLVSLHLDCRLDLPSGVFRGICKLAQLKSLGLNSACPPAAEYSSITNLNRLVELQVTHCANFTDQELSYLTNLTELRSVVLYSDGFSMEGTNLLRRMSGLTNVVVKVQPKNSAD